MEVTDRRLGATGTERAVARGEGLAEWGRRVCTPVLLFALAVWVRIGVANRTDTIFNDGPVFLAMSAAIRAGRWADVLSTEQHPGYPLLIEAASAVMASRFDAALAVAIATGSLAVVAAHGWLEHVWGSRVARVGALLLAIHPYAARFTGDVQSEGPYLACFLFSVWALSLAVERRSASAAFGAGFLAGLAYLIRPEGLGLVVAGVLLGLAGLRRQRLRGLRAITWTGALVLGAAIPAAPYMVALARTTGEIAVSAKKPLLSLIAPGRIDWIAGFASDAGFLASAAVFVAGLGVSILLALRSRGSAATEAGSRACAKRRFVAASIAALGLIGVVGPASVEIGTLLATLVSTLRPEIACLVVVGLFVAHRRGNLRATGFLATCIVPYLVAWIALLFAYGYLSRRHVLPPLVLLFGYAALGIMALGDRLTASLARRGIDAARAARIAALVVAIAVSAIQLPKTFHAHRASQLAARIAAERLRDHAAPGSRLASDRSKYGWYAGLEWRTARVNGRVRTLAELRAERVRYLLVERPLGPSMGSEEALWSGDPEYELVLLDRVDHAGRTAKVFELRDRVSERARPAD